MYTQCPNCHSHFRVTAEQLRAADGRVRCGVCDTVFDALEHLEEALPRTEPDPEAVAPPEPEDRPQAPVEDEPPPRRPR
ncbi:MAG: MJ0042-type zinc finger domain-containing protein, partial [Thiohalospira sp.]